ncbi:MAG: TOBE domain-containing protein, partial [Devosia sp.]|nr:TOBE domain-containing protein [Devosia sp.]
NNGVLLQLDTPQNLYDQPQNMFVAGFIGSPSMNFLRGQIDGANFAVEGASIPLNGYKFDTPPATAVDGVLGVRPEHIAVGEDAQKMPFTIESEIEIVEPMGADTIAWTKIGGQSLTFRAASEVHLEPGQKVTIGFDPARGSIFHAESGERV